MITLNIIHWRYIHSVLGETFWYSTTTSPVHEREQKHYLTEKGFLRIELRVKGHWFRPPVGGHQPTTKEHLRNKAKRQRFRYDLGEWFWARACKHHNFQGMPIVEEVHHG